MKTFEILQIIIQSIVLVGVFATLLVYYRQLKAMMAQLEVARQSSTAQNFISVINYLQAEPVRQARTLVLTKLGNKQPDKWSERERAAASTVCSTYDVAAILLQMGLIPREQFMVNWGPSIRNCYRIVEPFLESMQLPDKGGHLYWNDFKSLAEQVDQALEHR